MTKCQEGRMTRGKSGEVDGSAAALGVGVVRDGESFAGFGVG
jgi:hypothetical protein